MRQRFLKYLTAKKHPKGKLNNRGLKKAIPHKPNLDFMPIRFLLRLEKADLLLRLGQILRNMAFQMIKMPVLRYIKNNTPVIPETKPNKKPCQNGNSSLTMYRGTKTANLMVAIKAKEKSSSRST